MPDRRDPTRISFNKTNLGSRRLTVSRIVRDLRASCPSFDDTCAESDGNEDLLEQDFMVQTPDRVWVGDVVYVWTAEGWTYLAVLLDLYSRRVVGWAMDDSLRTDLPLRALQRAL